MARSRHVLLSSALVAALLRRAVRRRADLKDLYFGEAIFEADRATTSKRSSGSTRSWRSIRRVDEPQRDTLHYHIGHAEFRCRRLRARLPHAPSRRPRHQGGAGRRTSTRSSAMKPRSVSRASISRRTSRRTRCMRWSESTARSPKRSATTSSSCARTSTWRSAARQMQSPVLKRLQGAQDLTGFAAYNLGIALLQDRSPAGGARSSSTRPARSRARRRDRGDPRQVEHGARPDDARVRRLRSRAAVVRSRAARRSVFEPGVAQRRMGRRFRRQLRESARAVEHPGRSRRHRQRRAGSAARSALCVQQVERVRPRSVAVRPGARFVRRGARARWTPRSQHPRRASS